ncbi:SprB repeat-containing protein, partial [Flavobacterium sp. NRK1]|nr:SprB repeat-containing protein [Flavobacterium sp. NRK1]
YVINVKDALGCELASSVITVGQPAAALIATATSTDEICINANDGSITVTPTDGTGPYAVSLNGGAFTTPPSAGPITISNLSDTTYTIDVRDANGCTYTLPAAITIAEGVDLQASIVTSQVCDETTITVSANPAIAAIDLTYALDGGTPQASNQFVVTGLTSGSHNIIVSHSNGCNSAPLTFNVAPVIPIVMGATSQIDVNCFGGSDGTATATATGGTAPLTYAIAPNVLPLVYSTYQATGAFTGLAAGDYVINVKDALGCELASSVITVGQPAAALTATATSTDEICINANDGTITVTPTDGTGPYQVSLNGGTFTTPPSAGPITISNLSDTTYTIDVRDANGCTYTLPAAITIAEGVDIQASIVTSQVCDETTITVSANPAIAAIDLTYALDGGTPQASNQFVVTGLSAGSHNIIVSHSNGCNSAPLTFNVAPVIPIVMGATSQTDVNCFGGSDGTATATATGGTAPLTYAIAPNVLPLVYGTYQATGAFTGLAAGDYI